MPELAEIEQAVRDYFSELPDYRPGDLVTRTQVEPLLGQEKQFAWLGENRQAILEAVPAETDFLVRELRSPAGRRFMGRIGAYPQAYDRLDRLTGMVRGKRNVTGLIRSREGHKWIQYLTTSQRGIELSQQMSRGKNMGDFEKPTGRLYTETLLLERIRELYTLAEQHRPATQEPPAPSRSPKWIRLPGF